MAAGDAAHGAVSHGAVSHDAVPGDAVPGDAVAPHDAVSCDAALTRAFGFLGKRWNGIILATLLNGPSGYAQLRRAVTGISDSTLSERLAGLAAAGLLQRTVCEGPPLSVAYRLTTSGEALGPALLELTSWARDYLPACPAVEAACAEPSR